MSCKYASAAEFAFIVIYLFALGLILGSATMLMIVRRA